MKTTMEDIAKAVGVSRTTVSRILSGKDSHSEETKRKVLEVAKKLNYTPNSLARAIKTKKTGNIGAIIYREHKRVTSQFYSPIIEAIIEGAKEAGYGLFIMTDEDIEVPAAEAFIERRVDGVILISTIGEKVIRRFKEQDVPVVLVNHVTSLKDIPYIIIDEYKGVYEGIKYLIGKGHSRISYIGGPLTARCYIKRFEAYIAAMEDAGLIPDSDLISFGESVYENGYISMKKFLELKEEDRPTAVFAANDMMAVGAMRAIYEAGFKVPDDMELMGFDDIEFSKYTIPSLSTIHVPKEQMGRKAVCMLKKLIDGEEIAQKELLLQTKLIIRGSC